jgi:hypothetical protein
MLQTRHALSGNVTGMPEPGRENEKYGRFLDQAKQEAALVALGGRQLVPARVIRRPRRVTRRREERNHHPKATRPTPLTDI